MSIITIESITDQHWVRDFAEHPSREAWYNRGLARFSQLCAQYGITEASIATPTPYIPERIATLCVLIACFADNLGSDFRAISESFNLDVFKQKKDIAEKELESLCVQFTPANCGYVPEDPGDIGTGMSFAWGRA